MVEHAYDAATDTCDEQVWSEIMHIHSELLQLYGDIEIARVRVERLPGLLVGDRMKNIALIDDMLHDGNTVFGVSNNELCFIPWLSVSMRTTGCSVNVSLCRHTEALLELVNSWVRSHGQLTIHVFHSFELLKCMQGIENIIECLKQCG